MQADRCVSSGLRFHMEPNRMRGVSIPMKLIFLKEFL